jgi:hypothetical protein
MLPGILALFLGDAKSASSRRYAGDSETFIEG